jgi:hypothetical protein
MEEEDRIQLVERAAERAQLLETVQQMPNGLNTMLGDRSEENLSDGTRPASLPPCLFASCRPACAYTTPFTGLLKARSGICQFCLCPTIGQTQRLSLARGFLKDAEAMLMDEPTSALVSGLFLSFFPLIVAEHLCLAISHVHELCGFVTAGPGCGGTCRRLGEAVAQAGRPPPHGHHRSPQTLDDKVL